MEASLGSIGVGVIGCGGMGRSHGLAYKTDPRARIICVADTDRERAKALAEEVKAEEYTDDYRALLQNPKVDAVSIVTPNHLHAQMSIEAAEGGKHILCEKPMALTVKECDEMIAAARRAGVVLAIGYVLRFFSVLQATKNFIVSDEAGAVKNISVIRWGGGLPRGWYREAEKLGGIVGVVCHEVDMLRWLVGEVKSVKLEADCLFGEVNYEDNIWMLFRFKSKAIGFLGWSLTSNIGIYEYAILGLKESLRVYPWEGRLIRAGRDKQRREQILKDNVPPVQKEIHSFLDCVDKGVLLQPMASGEDGKAVNAVVEQGIRSIKP